MTSTVRLQNEADAARAGLSTAPDDLRNGVTTTALTNGAMTFAKEGSAVARAAIDRAMASPPCRHADRSWGYHADDEHQGHSSRGRR